MGSSSLGDLHFLCFQHHGEMLAKTTEPVVYACQKPGCLVHYENTRGYFLDTTDPVTLKQEILPRVSCPTDGQPMYLAQVQPERRNFRLWKCPKCGATLTNEESTVGRKMGAGDPLS